MSLTKQIKSAFDAAQTDKGYGHRYHYMYALLFAAVKPKSLLEIGVAGGHSIRAWRKLFPEAELTGLDYKQREFKPIDNFNYVIGDSTDVNVARLIKPHDIIIDDSSHHVYDQIMTFTNFKDKFKYFYVIEDIGWQHKREDLPAIVNALKSCIIKTGHYGIAVYDSYNEKHNCCSLVVHAKGF